MADSGSPYNRVHFFPKNGNEIIIAGRPERIPDAIGVREDGVVGVLDQCTIDRVPGQLQPHTLYYAYVYMRDGVMKMDFSQGRHVEDRCSGAQVHWSDARRSLVGMLRTGPDGKVNGNGVSQLTLSWFNREKSSLQISIAGLFTEPPSGSENFYVPVGAPKLEFLTWCINGAFTESFQAPDVIVEGTGQNSTPGSYVFPGVEVDGVQAHHFTGVHFQKQAGDCGYVKATSFGANGAHEGYHYARPMIGHGGSSGRAMITSGVICVPALHS